MEIKMLELGLKKFGITLLFSVLAVFYQYFGQWGRFGIYSPTFAEDDREWKEITREYEDWINELDFKVCVDSGKTQEVCQTAIHAT